MKYNPSIDKKNIKASINRWFFKGTSKKKILINSPNIKK